jgi:hypothetical protein
MELPRRALGDELLRPGEMTDIRRRLRGLAAREDLATVIACAFDHRTRMLPYLVADTRAAPAGVRAVGSAMADAGFPKTRIVLQQWNPRFQPSRMRLDVLPSLSARSLQRSEVSPLRNSSGDAEADPRLQGIK